MWRETAAREVEGFTSVCLEYRALSVYAARLVRLSVAVSCLIQPALAAPPDLDQFAISAPPNAKSCSYPSVARLGDNRLLCVFSVSDGSRKQKLFVAGVESADHARTWSTPQVLIDTPDGND